MTSTNMPILYDNILSGIASDLGKAAFLWAVERPGEGPLCYRAEKFAYEVCTLAAVLPALIDKALNAHVEQGTALSGSPAAIRDSLFSFILARHANWRFGGNIKPSYAESVQ